MLPIELFSEICQYLTYKELRRLAIYMPDQPRILLEIEYLGKRKLKQIKLKASKITEKTYKQFLGYHRMRLSRYLNTGTLKGVRDRQHLREIFSPSSEMFTGLKKLLEETIIEWALKSDQIHAASATLLLYEKKEDQMSDLKLAQKFNTHFFKSFNFNLIISYKLKQQDVDCNPTIPTAMKYMLPNNLKIRNYGRRWKPLRNERKMKGLFVIRGHCRCCNTVSDLKFTGRV